MDDLIPQTLQSERLRLELIHPGHASLLPKLWGNWEVLRYTYMQLQPDIASCQKEIERILTYKAKNLVLGPYVLFVGEDLAGMAGIRSDAGKNWSLYYQLHPVFWGKGLASEAARTLLDHAFGTMQLDAVAAECLARNPASGNVLRKLGFELERLEEKGDCGHFKGERMEHYRISRQQYGQR